MCELELIENINSEQIVTATDRLLLGGGCQRATARRRIDLTWAARAAVAASAARRAALAAEQTLIVRRPRRRRSLSGIAYAVATAAWLSSVTFACLLT